jgi:hypothetical protein
MGFYIMGVVIVLIGVGAAAHTAFNDGDEREARWLARLTLPVALLWPLIIVGGLVALIFYGLYRVARLVAFALGARSL